jgi:hypothetical protein
LKGGNEWAYMTMQPKIIWNMRLEPF